MWIDREQFQEVTVRAAQKSGENLVLHQQLTALMTTLDWFRVRTAQLEIERAQLLFTYTGVKVPVPVITRPEVDKNPLSQMPHFGDIGDTAAAGLGIGWNDDGSIKYY